MPPSRPQPKKFDEIFADAYRRAEQRVRESVRRGELVPLEVIAQRMGTTHESISESVWAGRLFSVPVGQRVFFPSFFADRGLAREDLEVVIPGLASREPSSKFAFFTMPQESLGGSTPIEALKRGERDLVARLALAFNDGKRQSCQTTRTGFGSLRACTGSPVQAGPSCVSGAVPVTGACSGG